MGTRKTVKRPKVNTNPVANHYAGPAETIIEFGGTNADFQYRGGLISIREMPGGRMRVEIYRTDPGVDVVAPHTLTGDQAHVVADALTLATEAIESGATPWDQYDADPNDDPKADNAGYVDLIRDAGTVVGRIIGNAP